MGAIFFAFQIYGDFSGYSDIAIGTAILFGFQLCKLHFLIFQEILQNFGDVGISHYQLGFEIICIFRLAEAKGELY